MNKSYLILGGACAVSSAIGAAGGYLIAKKRFNQQLDLGIAVETEKTKKYYANLVSTAMKKAIAEPEEEEAEEEPELSEVDEAVIAKGRETLARASSALVDYQGMAGNGKPPLEEVVQNNIFDPKRGKKALPPRGAGGKFVPKGSTEVERQQEHNDPYMIKPDEFLANDPENHQESLWYFVNDKTLIMVADNEAVDVDLVGEVNLTLIPDDEPRVIYVRNEGAGMDYQITLTENSLTEHMGLGEEDPDDDEDDEMGNFAEEGDLRYRQ